MLKFLDFVIYWSIVLLPFSMAVAPAPTNVFMGWIIAAFVTKKLIKKDASFLKTKVSLPLLLLFIVTCISIIHSVDIKDTLRGGILRLLQFIFIFFALSSEVKDKKHAWRIFFSVIAGVIFSTSDGIWQVITGKDFVRGYVPIINLGMVRATAAFQDANAFGVYLSALTPLILGLTPFYFKNRSRIIMILVSILSLAGIALTYSRPTLLAIYVVLWFFALVKKQKVLLIGMLIFSIAAPFIAPKPVKEWAKLANYNPIIFMCNDDRVAIFRNSFQMIKAHPIMGVGANTFMKNYKKYKEYPEFHGVITSDYLYAHNNFLHLTAELGLIGLVIFLWLLYAIFSESFSIYRKLKDNFFNVFSLSLIACLIAFMVNGLTESSLYSSRLALIFWYLAGFSIGLRRFIDARA